MGSFDQEIIPHCEFNYVGFEADVEAKKTVQIAMRKILSQAPSKSRGEVTFKKNGNLIFGAITVQSIHGDFSAFGENEKLDGLLWELQDQVLLKLSAWKRQRFQGTSEVQAS